MAYDRPWNVSQMCKTSAQRLIECWPHGCGNPRTKYRGEALDRAKRLEPIIREMQNEGYSMRRMATELTKRKVKTPRGGDWHPQTVKMVIQRLAA